MDRITHTHTHTSSYYVHVHVVLSLHCAWLSQEAHPNGVQLITLALIPYLMSTSDGKSSTVNFSHRPSFCLDLRENKAAYIHEKAPGMAVKIKSRCCC